MKKSNIFIHIPKTGGTTLNAALKKTYWQTTPDFYYRHILPNTRVSNAGDIFDPKNIDKYLLYHIFMMMRDPIDRTISEYYFIRERKTFMNLISKSPIDFKKYINSTQTQNGVINFLIGNPFFSSIPSTEKHLENIITCIEDINISIGIFEHFNTSLQYFSEQSDLKWKSNVEVKRITFLRPKKDDLEEDLKDLLLKKNKLDNELYQYCLERFKNNNNLELSGNVKFIKDKYNHVIPYAFNFCFFEFCLKNKKYILVQESFFKPLTFFILKERKINDGKTFVELWNISFINAINDHCQGSALQEVLSKIELGNHDPFEGTLKIACAIDLFFENDKTYFHQYYNPMVFKEEYVPQTKSNFTSKISAFFKK